METHTSTLWRNHDFVKLWAGQTISLIGSQVTFVALPLMAVLVLQATPVEMGILGAVQFMPGLLLGLFAGVWIDRLRKRTTMIVADLGRAVLIGTIPVMGLFDVTHIEYLYVVAFLTGCLSLFFDLAHVSFLPTLVQSEQLVDGNSKLQVSLSVAQVAGPGLAGALVQFFTAPLALIIDAISFVISAISVVLIRTSEPTQATRQQRNIWSEIREGLRVVRSSPILSAIAGSSSTLNLFVGMFIAVYILYLNREVGLPPAALGLVYSAFGPGTLVGAFLTQRTIRYIGLGRTIISALVLAGIADLGVLYANGLPVVAATVLLVAAQCLIGFTGPMYSISMLSLRQAVTQQQVQGRVNAIMRLLGSSAWPLGSVIGGMLGQRFGLGFTIVVAAFGVMLASLWIIFSPIATLREIPPRAEPTGEQLVAG